MTTSKRSKKKKRWLFLILLLPISFLLYYWENVFFRTGNIWTVCWTDIDWVYHCNWDDTRLFTLKKILDGVFAIWMIIWLIWLIPWIVLFIKGRKE